MIKKCKVNENHWYSDHLFYCPWCKIANETGKDPFPSPSSVQNAVLNTAYSLPNPIRNSVQNITPVPGPQPLKSSYPKILVFGAIIFLLIFGSWNLIRGDDEILIEVQEDSLNTLEEETATAEYSDILNSHRSTMAEDELPETYTNSIDMEFMKIPAGEFVMGLPKNEEGKDDEGDYAHKVRIEKPYYLGKYEVTQKQWLEVMGDNPSYFQGSSLPVEQVSWYDVQEFIKKLNEIESTDKYRLPSEAEWEYACCANNSTRYSLGDDQPQLHYYAWYNRNSVDKTHPVGQKKPNAWDLYDMHGNVWEWVAWNDDYPYTDSSGGDREQDDYCIARGGSWSGNSKLCLSNYSFKPDSHNYNLGFRVLKEI